MNKSTSHLAKRFWDAVGHMQTAIWLGGVLVGGSMGVFRFMNGASLWLHALFFIGVAVCWGIILKLLWPIIGKYLPRKGAEGKSDYWRCPDGKLHEWTYWRGENTGVYMCKNCRTQVDKATLKAHTDQGPLRDPDDSRQKVREINFQSHRPPYAEFRKRIEDAHEVWAFWHSGASAKNNGLFRTGRIKQLLLVFPNHEGLASLADMTHIDVEELRRSIFEAAKEAERWNVEVKWWQGLILPPFTIGDPTKSGNTWVVAEHIVPYQDADLRPSNYITDPQICDRYREAFMEMWNNRKLTGATVGLKN
ncbi:MAG: hypothetical protein HY666_02035 [Chloroflexi bacterium]|nr:hypothetical protein [Chloroflexota bacterium]